MRSLAVILAAAGLAAIPASAPAGSSHRYSGTSEEGVPITFRASTARISGFTAGVELRCVNSGDRIESFRVPSVRVRRGRFFYDGLMKGSYLYLDGRMTRSGRASGTMRFIASGNGDFCGSSPVRWIARSKR